MKWHEQQVSLYSSHADNFGTPATLRDILMCDFARDLDAIIDLRQLDRSASDYKNRKLALKATLQCFTPAGLLETKKHGMLKEIYRTGLMQLDFDYNDISEYDVEELKQCVFSLSFIAFCGLSCSGDGFYALALIAEPDKLAQYAEHCFEVLLRYGIKADTSKGKKVENLRYVSYDSNMLLRDDPDTLRVKKFYTKPTPRQAFTNPLPHSGTVNESLVKAQLKKISEAQTGQRWQVVQQVAYTLGGLGDSALIYSIKNAIESNSEFAGQENKYCKCAEDCFQAGNLKPLIIQ